MPKSKANKTTDVEATEKPGTGSSLSRMLSVLELFTLERPAWTIEDIATSMGFTLSSAYRYVRELGNAGLLTSVGRGKYVLGTRIIELDRQISLCDPVEQAGRAVAVDVMDQVTTGGVLICALRGDHMVTLYSDKRPQSLSLSRERGRTASLFRGAPAKAMLAQLSSRRLSRLYLDNQDEISATGLGDRWPEFQKAVAEMRKQRIVVTRRDFGLPYFAVGAPVFDGDDKVVASISILVPDELYAQPLIDKLSAVVTAAAQQMNQRISDLVSADVYGLAPDRMQTLTAHGPEPVSVSRQASLPARRS